MMQGADIHIQQDSAPSFGCLFTGELVVEEDFAGCKMEFACDLVYKGKVDKRYHLMYDKVGWKKMPPIHFLLVQQPKQQRLRKRWMRDWLKHGRVKAVVVVHQDTDYVEDNIGSYLSDS